MKTKILLLLLTGSLLALAAWLAHLPYRVHTYLVPATHRVTVDRGLKFLIVNQFPDGHWESDGGKFPVATTALRVSPCSWRAATQTRLGAGAVYATAVWCIILQLDGNGYPSLMPMRFQAER